MRNSSVAPTSITIILIILNQNNIRMILFDPSWTIIRRGIVYDNNFKGRISSLFQRIQALRQDLNTIPVGDNNRNSGIRFMRLWVCIK